MSNLKINLKYQDMGTKKIMVYTKLFALVFSLTSCSKEDTYDSIPISELNLPETPYDY